MRELRLPEIGPDDGLLRRRGLRHLRLRLRAERRRSPCTIPRHPRPRARRPHRGDRRERGPALECRRRQPRLRRSARPLRQLPRVSRRHSSPVHRPPGSRLVRILGAGPAAGPLGRLRGLPLPLAALGRPQDRRVYPAGDRHALQPDRRGLPLGRRDAEPPARRDESLSSVPGSAASPR